MSADCVFCKIGAGAIPVTLTYEDDEFVAFPDLHPQAPVHLLVVPRRHLPTLYDVAQTGTLGRALDVARESARLAGVDESGFRLVLNTGPDAGQEIDHLHFHLLGGRAMGWPPG